MDIKELRNSWLLLRQSIEQRLNEFKNLWNNGNEEDLFAELVFCIFTPQSKAKSCWSAVAKLVDNKLLTIGTGTQIAGIIGRNGVRFKNNKARYVVNTRKLFENNGSIKVRRHINQFKNVQEKRDWLVENIKGIGYKEASHFLRNIGFGKKLAILDRHILKNLKLLGVIHKIPVSLSRTVYLKIEKKMSAFSKEIKMPMDHMDLLMWHKETGEIFK